MNGTPHGYPVITASGSVNVLHARPLHTCICVQAADRCMQPLVSKVYSQFQPSDLHAKTRRVVPDPAMKPELWTREEAYFRTGIFSSALQYQANGQGGARCVLPLFAADAKRSSKARNDCVKRQHCQGALSPGLMVRLLFCKTASSSSLAYSSMDERAKCFQGVVYDIAVWSTLSVAAFDSAARFSNCSSGRATIYSVLEEIYATCKFLV
jgi:hypothetical protein